MAKTVLVVDDELDFLELLDAVLTLEGYHVVTCANAGEAYQLARQTRPDVVIVDLLMPGQSGWQVINQIKSDPSTARSAVILCTGAVAEAMRQAEQLKANHDVLLKPFNLSDLLDLVSKATRSKAS